MACWSASHRTGCRTDIRSIRPEDGPLTGRRADSVTTEESFLAAIIDCPEDDTHRLVYADWLDDHGQPERAEFIRLQCRLACLSEEDPQREQLEKRERELLN